MEEWAAINGCDAAAPAVAALPDPEDDGTTSERQTWTGCEATTEHLRIEGGGHTWPNGHQYLRAGVVGPVWRDWGNELLWDFFEDHPMP